jgi:hypothetical protein
VCMCDHKITLNYNRKKWESKKKVSIPIQKQPWFAF